MTMIIEGVTCGNCTKRNGIPVKHATAEDVRKCYAGRYGTPAGQRVGEEIMSDAEETRLIQARERAEDERVAAEKARRDAHFLNSPFYKRAQAGRYVGGNKQTPAQALVEEDPWVKVRALQRQLPNEEHARYAIQVLDFEHGPEPVWKFYQIDKPQQGKWRGRTFVSVMASDTTYAIRKPESLISILTAILHDPVESGRNYWNQIGKCWECHRTLTDEESIARGLGPDCARKLGRL